ncbi:SulP family sulfate permease [Mesorhizobium soli]|uniref:SulP family inorganic anion transporter n=1 Tax=Pseudaminobacter soli (ex Li et al. 2025) TaxID=1295366 RepID=UPI00247671E6|nr:SulP family inorganic anion transporter [Mesorhizobium soli]MDH6231088.1 SulP family sulfate permease [Mesorhizobium soli]
MAQGDVKNGTGSPNGSPRLLFAAMRGWSWGDFGSDAIAGLTLAAIAIPEQMATARLGNFSPELGFLAFIAGAVAFAIFGASRYLSAGGDSTITPIFAGGLALVAASASPHYVALAAALALLVGLTVCLAGIFRLGWVADLLSVPVTAGFLAGISVHIVISQLPDLLGLPPGSGSVFQRVAAIWAEWPQINIPSLVLGLGVFLLVIICERISPRIPGALIAIALATLAVVAFGLEQHGVKVLGPLPGMHPGFAFNTLVPDDLRTLVPLALLISVVIMVQTAATTRSFPPSGDESPDVNRDFVGVGAGNLLAGLVGAYPVDASPPRTAIVAATGGRSQVGGLVAAAIVLVLALFGGTLLTHVPQAALAGILLFVAMRILRWTTFAQTLREARGEFALIVITALAIIALPIEVGVAIGIGLSLLYGLWGMAQASAIELERVPGTSIWWPPADKLKGERVPGVLVVGFQAPLSFVNAEKFKQGFRALVDARAGELKHVVLEASSIIAIDYTAAGVLQDMIGYCRQQGATFSIARLESVRAQAALERFGIASDLGPDNIFRSVENAIDTLSSQPSPSPPTHAPTGQKKESSS